MYRIILAALLLMPAHAAIGQMAGREKFTCDAPGGAFSRYERTIGSGAVSLNAKVRINQLRTGSEWRPVVNVTLNAGGSGNRAGFRILPDRARKKAVVFVAFPGMRGGEETPVGELAIDAELLLAVNIDGNGTQLSVNGVSQSGQGVRDASWSLDLSCSSIDAHIDEITVRGGQT